MSRPGDKAAVAALAAGVALCAALALAWWLLRDSPPPAPSALESGAGTHDGSDSEAPPLTADAGAAVDGTRAPSGDAEDAPKTATTLTGLVTDEGGTGLRGATVSLFPLDPQGVRGAPFPDGPRLDTTTTDREGAFTLRAPPSGWLRVVASAPGRATVGERVPGPGARVVIRLPRAAALAVRVLDPEGKPIPDAAVQARVEASVVDARGNTEGVADFPALPPGSVRLRVGAAGHGTVVAGPYAVRADEETEALVVLPPGVPISGTVVDDATGAPLAGAEIYVAHPGRAERAEPTGPDGRFGPLAGSGVGERVFLAAHAEGHEPLLEPVVLGALEGMTVVLRMRAAAAWRGRVVTPDGRPAAGAQVAYTANGVAGRRPAAATADADGRFQLPPPPPQAPGRRVVLHARLGDGSAALALRPGSLAPDPLVLRLEPGGRAGGRVVDPAGRPMVGVQIRLTPAWEQVADRGRPDAATSRLLLANEQGFAGLAAASDGDGRWGARNIPPGPYHVRFRWSGGSHWRADVLEVGGAAADAGTETLGRGGRLTGRVTDRTGRALAGAQLRLAPTEDARRSQRAVSGVDGWFEFHGLPDGVHDLRVSYGTLPDVKERVEIRDGAEQRVDPQFDPGAVLEGRVTDASGKPYRGILTVTLRRDGSARPHRAPFGVAVAAGRFQVDPVQIGTWIVEAHAPGGLRAEARAVDVAVDRTTTVSLSLERNRTVHGQVRTAAGRPVPGASIGLRHETTSRRHLATADADGRFRFADLAPGTWVAEFSGRGGAAGREPFDVEQVLGRPLILALGGAGSVRVLVRDARGDPVSQALVTFRTPEGRMATRVPTRTDRSGSGVGRDLPVGSLVVTARTLDGRAGQAQVIIREGDTAEVEVRVAKRDGR